MSTNQKDVAKEQEELQQKSEFSQETEEKSEANKGEIEESKQESSSEQEIKESVKEDGKSELNDEKPKEQKKTKNKHELLLERVNKTKEKAEDIYQTYLEFEQKLTENANQLAKTENNILKTTVAQSISLLKELGVDSLEDEMQAVNEIKLDNKEQLLTVKEPSKGGFKGFVAGLLFAGIGAVSALGIGAYLAKLPFGLNTFLQKTNLDAIASKYASFIAPANPSAAIGYTAIGVLSLILGFVVYKAVTLIQRKKNEKYVSSLEESVQDYEKSINNKNQKMEELIEHIDHIKMVMQKYDIILQEQNAKLNRIKFIEQPQSLDSLHKSSKVEVEKTNLILDELLKLMNTPVNSDIEILEKSLENLKSANILINEVIKKIYA